MAAWVTVRVAGIADAARVLVFVVGQKIVLTMTCLYQNKVSQQWRTGVVIACRRSRKLRRLHALHHCAVSSVLMALTPHLRQPAAAACLRRQEKEKMDEAGDVDRCP